MWSGDQQIAGTTMLLKPEMEKSMSSSSTTWYSNKNYGPHQSILEQDWTLNLRTWLAVMYNSRLYTVPCQAVFEKAPVTLTIFLFKENMRYNLRMYWKRATRNSVSLLCPDQEYLIAGITDQVMICNKRKKEWMNEIWEITVRQKVKFPSTHEYDTDFYGVLKDILRSTTFTF